MKEELCRAFCNEVSVKDVPVGLAVSTPFRRSDGDAVSFYVIKRDTLPGIARLEDDGQTIPYLEACGVDFATSTRQKAFEELLVEYGAEYDESENVIRTPNMRDAELPRAALRFTALLLRLYDFLLLTQEHVESTFKEDAKKRIKQVIGERAAIKEDAIVSAELAEVTPDLLISATGRDPVAIFLTQSATRVQDAIFLQMAALYEAKQPLSVVALVESERTLTRDMQRRAGNRLTAVTTWEGDQIAAIQRIEREAIGAEATRN
ncbi:MAG TPA: DUF1828 domain-containing protein [Xanthobacteraceae bacterium]|nr:DUF1828 domain-containing protein [Xanthobacteraceae bacterium]